MQDDAQEVEEKEFVRPSMTLPPKLEEVFTLVKAAHVKKTTALDVYSFFFQVFPHVFPRLWLFVSNKVFSSPTSN